MFNIKFTTSAFILTSLLSLENTFAMRGSQEFFGEEKLSSPRQSRTAHHQEKQEEAFIQTKIKIIPKEFMTIKFKVDFRGGKAVVRCLEKDDLNELFIDRLCVYDETDPTDNFPDAPRPTLKEIEDYYIPRLNRDVPQDQARFGVFDSENNQILSRIDIMGGKHFYNSCEFTILISADFRRAGLGKAMFKNMFESIRTTTVSIPNCPIHFIEASINYDNIASKKAATSAGMINLKGTNIYYFPLREGLGVPTRKPFENEDGGATEEADYKQ